MGGWWYAVAAVLNASIIPYTAMYMEPGINGAGKWKCYQLLRDEDKNGRFVMVDGQGVGADTAREGWKRWAEGVDMKTIAETWAKTNMVRYVVTGVAVVSSGIGIVVGR
jgi:hypothetical protein